MQHPGSGLELRCFSKARPERTAAYDMASSVGVLFFLGFGQGFGTPASSLMVHQTKFSKAMLPDCYRHSDLKCSELELLAADQKTHRPIAARDGAHGPRPRSRSDDAEQAAARIFVYFAADAKRYGFIVTPSMPARTCSPH